MLKKLSVCAMNWTDSPRWSPTGEWIVFAGRKRRGEPINIFLIDITGNQLRQLTKDAGMLPQTTSIQPDEADTIGIIIVLLRVRRTASAGICGTRRCAWLSATTCGFLCTIRRFRVFRLQNRAPASSQVPS